MKRSIWSISIVLLAVAAAEFGLLGAASAGASFVPSWLAASRSAPPAARAGKTPCPSSATGRCPPPPPPTPVSPPATPVSPPVCQPDAQHGRDQACEGQPASMQLTPDPLTISCDGSEPSTITVRVTDVNGRPVPDGTAVYFSTYNGNTTPAFALTRKGLASTLVVFYGELFKPGPNVIVDAGVLEAGVRVRCFPSSNQQPPSPPVCSPACPTPTPYVPPTPYPTPAPNIGGEISFGTPSLAGSNITLPILTSAAQDPYIGANVDLVLDRSQLSAVGVEAGPALQGPNGALCLSKFDFKDGALAACASMGLSGTTAAGTLVTFTLAPLTSSGCVRLHLFTYGPPDGGDSTAGTYTMASIAPGNIVPQQNTYGPDITVDLATGATGCTPVATSTPTAVPTATPTPTPGIATCVSFTDACSPTATATPTPFSSLPTATPTPDGGVGPIGIPLTPTLEP